MAWKLKCSPTSFGTSGQLKKFADLVVKTMKAIQSSAGLKPISKFFEDKLITAKLAFFISLADDLEPFLREFQSDSPTIFYMEV